MVGSGPAGMYAADELLTQTGVTVNVFDKLPTPYGLARAGVAPDHRETRAITALFDRIAATPGFSYFLNVEVGQHLSHSELLGHHHAVLYAVGASGDRRLEVEGAGLPGLAVRPRPSPGSTGTPASPTGGSTSATNGWSSSATATSLWTSPGS